LDVLGDRSLRRIIHFMAAYPALILCPERVSTSLNEADAGVASLSSKKHPVAILLTKTKPARECQSPLSGIRTQYP